MARRELEQPVPGRAFWVVVAAVVAALALGIVSVVVLTGDDGSPTKATGEPAATPPPGTTSVDPLEGPDAPWQVSIEQISAGVVPQRREATAQQIQTTLTAWVDGGFAGGYPRSDFAAAFTAWTAQAAALGRRDRETTTNATLGPELTDLVADARQARLFVFASEGVVGGATARVMLRFTGRRDSGDLIGLTVKGDLRLTRDGATWRIFGYDLERDVSPR